jgi:flagellar protein FliO/FliZ
LKPETRSLDDLGEIDLTVYFRFVLALIFVLGLILLVGWALRRFSPLATRAMRGGGRRLEVVEALQVDNRRRVVLLRCDNREHVVLLGASNDLVIDGPLPVQGSTADFAAHLDKADSHQTGNAS